MVALLNMQAEISARRQQLETLRSQVTAQDRVNKDLKRRIGEGLDDEIVEALARERLDYAYPDEIVYIDISGS
jgi:cell division protein FtsB